MSHSKEELDWDVEQLRVLVAEPNARLLVEAAPGAGKTEVACGRVAELIREGVRSNRILLISFTNAAVQEMRDRIGELLDGSEVSAHGVRLRTIDSLAGMLRHAYTEGEASFDGYTENIEQFVELLEEDERHLRGFIRGEYEHVIVDEAQDVIGIRRRALLELFDRLAPDCGITVFGDHAQSIYGWTDDDQAGKERTGANLVQKLRRTDDFGFRRIELTNEYRTSDQSLASFFSSLRGVVTAKSSRGRAKYHEVRERIRTAFGAEDFLPLDELTELIGQHGPETLVLFRTRCALAMASSYLSDAGISHRIRHSGMPTGMQPWVAAIFSDYREPRMSRADFLRAWEDLESGLRGPPAVEEAWRLIYGLAGEGRETIKVQLLRSRLGTRRPPEPLLQRELGQRGPLLSTIHAAKGREAPKVVLLFPHERKTDGQMDADVWEEEARVLYVGATRPRSALKARRAPDPGSGFINDRRVARKLSGRRVQIMFGLSGDVDASFSAGLRLEQINSSARAIQGWLKRTPVEETEVTAELERLGGRSRRILREEGGVILGALSGRANGDLWDAGVEYFGDRVKPAPNVQHLWRVGLRSVVVPDDEGSLSAVATPYRDTGFWLAPVIKGFPTHPYWSR